MPQQEIVFGHHVHKRKFRRQPQGANVASRCCICGMSWPEIIWSQIGCPADCKEDMARLLMEADYDTTVTVLIDGEVVIKGDDA